ncbi:MAG: DNA double-strand break repair nuclease NurA [archaeon]
MGFLQFLENVVTHIQGMQKRHEHIGMSIRSQATKPITHPPKEPLPESQLAHPLHSIPLEGKMGGTDSGFVSQSFYSIDLMMLRTCGASMEYENGKMVKTRYHPETFSLPDPIVNTQGLEREEFHKFVSLTRLQAEITNAAELIQKHALDVCFLDGSLILHPMDKPANDSSLLGEYRQTIHAFVELYATAEKNECTLIGAIEDSRSTRLGEWIEENLGSSSGIKQEKLHDVPLMEKVLQAQERSIVFPLAENISKHVILQDFPEKWAGKLHACYLKPSKWDYPLRIEFLCDSTQASAHAQRCAEITYAQSRLHKEYAFPSVLIEADMHAGLKQEEVELVSDKILSKLGRNTLRMRRRDRRPF